MKKNMKRVVTLVLCAVMALGLLAVSASADSQLTDVDGLVTSKTVTSNSDGTYTVTLDAYATGAEKIEVKKVAVPLDIVIALDVSDETKNKIVVADREKSLGSIDSEYGKNASSTTDTSNPDLVYELDDTIYNSWTGKPSDILSGGTYHWQALKYAEKHWWYMGWANQSGIWRDIESAWDEAGMDIRVKKIDAEKMAAMKFINSILTNANDPENDDVQYRVSVVKYGGTLNDATGNATYDGNKNYSQIVIEPTVVSNDAIGTFKNAIYSTTTITAGGDADLANGMTKVSDALTMMSDSSAQKVVVVISGGSLDGDASAAVSTATDLKANKAAIYTFCIDDAKDAVPAQNTLNSMATSGSCVVTTQSSQLDAHLGSLFDKVDKEFSEGGSAIDLDASTVLQDVVTEYFDIVPGSASAHSEYAATKGNWVARDDSSKYTVDVSDRTVTATGFNYKENWVGTTNGEYHAGSKLVLTFQIKPRDGFLGGNGVPTNVTADCGIYSGTTLVENFPDSGTKNVPLADLTVEAQAKNVYLTNIPTVDQMKEGAVVKFNGTTLDLNAVNYGLAEWQVEYIDSISLTGAAVGADFNGTADSSYTLTGTIRTDGASETFTGTAVINVFTPTLHHSDRTIYLGDTPIYFYTEAWKHNETSSTAVTMLGSKPALNIIYNYMTFTDCKTDVNIATTKINGTDVTEYVKSTSFAVHVLQPTLTAEDVTIYRGDQVTDTVLDAAMQDVTWACTCTGSNKKTTATSGSKPTATYDYGTIVDACPENCTNVTATLKLNGTPYSDYTESFTVHVLQPEFTVNVNDVWADYVVAVDLATNCVNYTVHWNDDCTPAGGIAGTTVTPVGDEPNVDTENTAFVYDTVTGLTNGVYTVSESDQTIHVISLNYRFSNGLTGSVAYTDQSFTVHVNTFNLTINKTWGNGKEHYQQDAIFSVKRGTEVLKVVIPQGKDSVTVAGLLCGQSYTVTEDTNWSWRWSSTTDNTTTTGRTHAHATEIVKEKPADCTVTMSFTNKLKNDKTQWLSGTDYAHNVYSGDNWSRIDGTAVTRVKRALGIN